MNHDVRHHDGFLQVHDSVTASGQPRSWLRRWFMTNALLSGIFALAWLVLRSGSKPSRFTYPCQQAAFGTAAAAFGVPLVATLISARRGLVAALATRTGRLVAAFGLVVTLSFGAWAFTRGSGRIRRRPPSPTSRRLSRRCLRSRDCPRAQRSALPGGSTI